MTQRQWEEKVEKAISSVQDLKDEQDEANEFYDELDLARIVHRDAQRELEAFIHMDLDAIMDSLEDVKRVDVPDLDTDSYYDEDEEDEEDEEE